MTPAPREIVWDEQSIARIWAYYAGNRSIQDQYFSRVNGIRVLQAARGWIDFGRGRILDYGCGPGYLIEHLLAAAAGKVHGLEFEPDAAARANSRFSRHPAFGGVEFAGALPSNYAAQSMDAVLCIEVLEHLDDAALGQALAEIRRVLRPGGRLVVTTPREEDLEAGKAICPHCATVFHRWQHVRAWSAASLSQALAGAGFRVVTIEPKSFAPEREGLCERARALVARALGIGPPKPPAPQLFAVAEKAG